VQIFFTSSEDTTAQTVNSAWRKYEGIHDSQVTLQKREPRARGKVRWLGGCQEVRSQLGEERKGKGGGLDAEGDVSEDNRYCATG